MRFVFCLLLLVVGSSLPSFAAVSRLDSLKTVLLRSPMDTSRTRLMTEIAAEYFSLGQAEACRSLAEELRVYGMKIGDNTALGKSLMILGNIAFQQKKHDSAQHYFLRAFSAASPIHDDVTAGRGLLGAGLVEREYSNLDKALDYFLQAKPFLLRSKNARYVNYLYNNIGGVYTFKADLAGEVQVRKELFAWNTSMHDTVYMAQTCNGIALLYAYKGLYKEAIPWAEKAVRLYKSLQRFADVSNSYLTIGEAHLKLGHYDIAIEKYLECYSLAEKAGSMEGMANTLTNIAGIYYDLHNYDESKRYFERALAIYSSMPVIDRIENNKAICHNAIGEIYFQQGKYDKALQEFNAALLQLSLHPNISTTASCKQYISQVYYVKKDYATALEYLRESLRLYESVIENEGIASSLASMAEVHFALKNYDSTVFFGEKSLTYSTLTNIQKQLQVTYDILSQAYHAKHNEPKAYSYLLRAYQLKDSLLTFDKTREIGKIEASYQMKKKQEEEQRAQEIRFRQTEEARQRKNNIEYLGILIFVIGSLVLLYFIRKTGVKATLIERYVFLLFLLVFEFVGLLLNDPINSIAGGDQLINLLAAVVIAVILTPIHTVLHTFIVKKLLPKQVNAKMYEQSILSDVGNRKKSFPPLSSSSIDNKAHDTPSPTNDDSTPGPPLS